jgi:hypothetical protein
MMVRAQRIGLRRFSARSAQGCSLRSALFLDRLAAAFSIGGHEVRERARRVVSERARKRWIRAIKAVLAVLVLLAIGRHIAKTWAELATHRARLQIDLGPVALAIPLYAAGLGFFACYFRRIMSASNTPMALIPAVRAYYISHLGKYVPGKALVVVMRAGFSASFGARPATAAFATLYETLVMMAVGGLLAGAGFALPPTQWLAVALGAGFGVAFFVLVEPRIFPRLSRLISIPFPGVGPDALPSFSWRLLAEGFLWCVAGWILLGLSQVAVVSGLAGRTLALSLWPTVIASVALATVAGFAVAVMPGGLGVREWAIMTTLQPAVGETVAVASALLLRLTWVLGELIVAAILGPLRPRPERVSEP